MRLPATWQGYVLTVYRETGQPAAYIRQAGFDTIQQEQMALTFVKAHGRMTRSEVIDLCHVSESQASRLLDRLVERGATIRLGNGRGIYYEPRH